MAKEEVFQPLLVSTSMLTLATETVRSILKIDDIVNVMGWTLNAFNPFDCF